MKARPTPRIVSADLLNGSILIAFDDGTCALYSAELLQATLPQAEQIIVEPED
jgi:hypothetical protein